MKRTWFVFAISLVISVQFSCNMPKKTTDNAAGFDKQAHRGGRGLMPENTIPAMIHGVDLGVTTLEMDAVITADRKVLVSHETYYNSETTTIDGGKSISKGNQDSFAIYKLTYDETKKFDVGLKPYPAFPRQQRLKAIKPLLSDVIDTVENYVRQKKIKPVSYNIETKSRPADDNKMHPAPEEFVDLIMGVINEKNVGERTIIQSFDFRTLQVMHRKYSNIRLAMLIQNTKSVADNVKDLGFVPAIYSPNYMLVNAAMIEQCHQQKMKVIPWTVNDKNKIDSLKTMGVDGIITDYPDLF